MDKHPDRFQIRPDNKNTFFWHSCLNLCHTRQRYGTANSVREHGLQVLWETVASHMLSMLVNSGSRKCGIFLNLTPSAMLCMNRYVFVRDNGPFGHHCTHFTNNSAIFILYTTIQEFGEAKKFFFFWKEVSCSLRLHLFDKTVNTYLL